MQVSDVDLFYLEAFKVSVVELLIFVEMNVILLSNLGE